MYLQAVLAGSRMAALTVAREALRDGLSVIDLYVEVLQAALYEVGRLWETNRITVAHEHAATAITQFVMAQMYDSLERTQSGTRTILLTGLEGELHSVGALMVAAGFANKGYLGLPFTGALFCWTAIGLDPTPYRLPPGARVAFVFLAVPVHAVIGLLLVSTSSLLAGGWYAGQPPPWLDDVLADQRTGAGILWAAGEVFGLLLTGTALLQWLRADERAGRRADARVHAGT